MINTYSTIVKYKVEIVAIKLIDYTQIEIGIKDHKSLKKNYYRFNIPRLMRKLYASKLSSSLD